MSRNSTRPAPGCSTRPISAARRSTPRPGLTVGEHAHGIAIDASGHAYVTGTTDRLDFPLVRPIQSRQDSAPCFQCPRSFLGIGCSQAFVTQLAPDASQLVYSTYLGGTSLDFGRAIAVDQSGNAYVTGNASAGFPWTSPPNNSFSFSRIFVTKISDDGAEPPRFSADGFTNAASYAPGLSPGRARQPVRREAHRLHGYRCRHRHPIAHRDRRHVDPYRRASGGLYAVAGLETYDQINFQTPIGAEHGTALLTHHGSSAVVTGIPVTTPQPGLFLLDGVHAAAQHAAVYATVTSANRAHLGEDIILYATGLGIPYPGVPDGHAASADPFSRATESVRVFTEGGIECPVTFAGLAPGLVGVYQVNIVIAPNAATGDREIVILMRDTIVSNTARLWIE